VAHRQPEPVGDLQRLRCHDRVGRHLEFPLPALERGTHVVLGDDGHQLPSMPSRQFTAAPTAVRTSSSDPDRNSRPNLPTARTSTRLIEAYFSASLAAAAM